MCVHINIYIIYVITYNWYKCTTCREHRIAISYHIFITYFKVYLYILNKYIKKYFRCHFHLHLQDFDF